MTRKDFEATPETLVAAVAAGDTEAVMRIQAVMRDAEKAAEAANEAQRLIDQHQAEQADIARRKAVGIALAQRQKDSEAEAAVLAKRVEARVVAIEKAAAALLESLKSLPGEVPALINLSRYAVPVDGDPVIEAAFSEAGGSHFGATLPRIGCEQRVGEAIRSLAVELQGFAVSRVAGV